MNRVSKISLFVVAIILLIVPLVGAAEDEQAEPTIVDIAMNDGRFDTLVAALVATDMVEALSSGEWTVFAPTDEAFAKQGLNSGNIANEIDPETLTNIVLYHLLDSSVSSTEAKTMLGDITMANDAIAGLKYYDGSLWVNDDSRVIIKDIVAANGTIHVVDNVILPPWPRVDDEIPTLLPTEAKPADNSIAGIAIADGRFDTLVAAVVAADLLEDFSGGEWTAFAPTDDAFAKLGLDENNIATEFTKEELQNLLLYHVLEENVSSDEAKTMLGDITMANGHIAGLKYFDGSLWVNDDSRVIISDILADNGTIHVVDTVIQGPWPR